MNDVCTKAKLAKSASRMAAILPHSSRNQALKSMARALLSGKEDILQANKRDLDAAEQSVSDGSLSSALFARLKISEERIHELAEGMKQIGSMPDPLGTILLSSHPQPGLDMQRVTVPLGVLAVIFESRPDALPQIVSLAVKTGNGLLLKGGSEAKHTNKALFNLLNRAVKSHLPEGLFSLLETREEVANILALEDDIDLVIPRGSSAMIKSIQSQTRIPVLGHSEGICHIYVDEFASENMALDICIDSKTNYPAACNSVETILIHNSLLAGWLPKLRHQLERRKVVLFAGPKLAANTSIPLADNLSHEYADLAITLEVVSDPMEAISHINQYGSQHTDAIITDNQEIADRFLKQVDSACVFHNVSTRFADGYRLNLGAEVGISTNRLHARGPVGLDGLVTYAYQLRGKGQVVGKTQLSKNRWPSKNPSLISLLT